MALEDATNPMQGVSGPGPYAKRTDLQYQSESYGDGVAYDAAKSGAPLAKAQKSPMLSQAPQISAPQTPVTGMFDPTQRPNEPITHGIAVGEGAGPEALMMNQIKQDDKDIVAKYLPSLTSMASAQDTPESFRAFVSFLQGSL
jgi:hypothetical protein